MRVQTGACGILVAAVVLATMGCSDRAAVDRDNYWLDDSFSERALAWVDAQNAKTIAELSSDPRYVAYRNAAGELLTALDRVPYARLQGGYAYNYWQDRDRPLGIWRRASLDSYLAGSPDWETLINLDALSRADGREWIFHGATCRTAGHPDGEGRCLVHLAHKGQDAAAIREFDLAAKAFVDGGFNLPEFKSRMWWQDDEHVIVGTDFGPGSLNESGLPRLLKRWTRGAPLDSAETVFESGETDAGLSAALVNAAGVGTFVAVNSRDFFTRDYWLVSPGRGPIRLPLPRSFNIQGVFQGRLLMRLNEDWRPQGVERTFPSGALIALPLERLLQAGEVNQATVLYNPGPSEAIRDVVAVKERLYLGLLDTYRSRVIELTPGPQGGSIHSISAGDEDFISLLGEQGGHLLAKVESLLSPDKLVMLDPLSGERRTIFAMAPQFDADELVTELKTTQSRDGTPVSYTVMHRRDLPMDGSTPMLVYGYGGFDISITPRYEPVFGKLWLEEGGVYVHAYLRGGGEFGPARHRGAQLKNRQQPYDDMAAIIEDLQARGYSSPQHTGIMGRSNGGLMVATVMEQRPELMNAVVVGGPLIDMLHYQNLPPGASWMAEYGDPRDPNMRDYIASYSPQQNLRQSADYPVPLIITSTWDDRVLPGHARRFAAAMQALGHDALYFEDGQGGHYWELAGGPPPGDWRLRATARAVEYTYLTRRLGNGAGVVRSGH